MLLPLGMNAKATSTLGLCSSEQLIEQEWPLVNSYEGDMVAPNNNHSRTDNENVGTAVCP